MLDKDLQNKNQETPQGFKVVSEFLPKGDQPQAIDKLAIGLEDGLKHQVLMGATGTGKTFTMANVIQKINRPALVIVHNKTLAAQICNEFRELFPHNRVEFFVSYYDYFQPEAYIVSTDTYIEKDLAINDEIDKLRHSATSSLQERRDTIVIASVSCIYGLGAPEEYYRMGVSLRPGQELSRDELIKKLIAINYKRNDIEFSRTMFRVRGDTVEIFPANKSESAIRVEFFGDEVEGVSEFEAVSGKVINKLKHAAIFPASHYAVEKSILDNAITQILIDLEKQIKVFEEGGQLIEAQRIGQRVKYDVEMMREVGYCTGIENYSRYFDGRLPGQPPFTLLDYFPKDFVLFVDESHITLPQVRAMYRGDLARKTNLVSYGFRLPAAYDNRPLMFEEFNQKIGQAVYVSATPAPYELGLIGVGTETGKPVGERIALPNDNAVGIESVGDAALGVPKRHKKSQHGTPRAASPTDTPIQFQNTSNPAFSEQVIRPTGLVDPKITVRPIQGQIDDLLDEIKNTTKNNERVLVTTLTKKMAESLSKFLSENGQKVRYLHSDIGTLERIEIINGLRAGEFDVLVGINLLREGLDIPEVSLVAILDADKEGFLRSTTSLIQTIGRAARNANGRVIMYANARTRSMDAAISETDRRREKQEAYNNAEGIVPKTIVKPIKNTLNISSKDEIKVDVKDIPETIEKLKALMAIASSSLDFEKAIELREKIGQLKKMMGKMKG